MRQALDKILAAALAAVDPYRAVQRHVTLRGKTLVVVDREYDLRTFRRVVVVGAGKASAPMAAALEDIIGDALPVEGSVTVRYGHSAPTRWVQIREAGHPMPDENGVSATRAIVELLSGADERDLILCVISGGGSALLMLPADGLTLEDIRQTTDALLRCGAPIGDFNVVRKHLDVAKGGGLARLAAPSPLVTLVLSDVVGNPLDAIASGPTVPDTSTWADARAVFERYRLWDFVPDVVAARLRSDLPDTPKPGDPLFSGAQTVVVGSNLLACEAAAAEAEQQGFKAMVLTTYVEGEAREAGRVLAGLLREVHASGHPLPRPCCLIAGGETTVTVRGEGKGGRNQELALSAAFALKGVPDVLLASIGTDGNDGPTDAAGAWVDGFTLGRGGDAEAALRNNDSYTYFDSNGQLIKTGPTNTNVNDLYILLAS